MLEIGLDVPAAALGQRAWRRRAAVAERIGFPVIVRPSFTLGGSGGGIAYNREEFEDIVARGLELSARSTRS